MTLWMSSQATHIRIYILSGLDNGKLDDRMVI